LQLADRTLSFPKGILKNICVRVGTSYVPADFVVIETGVDERSPIILGRPFLNTSGAIIYASAAKNVLRLLVFLILKFYGAQIDNKALWN